MADDRLLRIAYTCMTVMVGVLQPWLSWSHIPWVTPTVIAVETVLMAVMFWALLSLSKPQHGDGDGGWDDDEEPPPPTPPGPVAVAVLEKADFQLAG